MTPDPAPPRHDYNPSEMGAIAHLYRAEVYRSTIWRTRLDNTTNWSIVTMGIALTTTFSSREASPATAANRCACSTGITESWSPCSNSSGVPSPLSS